MNYDVAKAACIQAQCIIMVDLRDFGRAWLVQLVRSLLYNHKVPVSIPAVQRFDYLCDLLFRLS